jgi:hypothetical protein
MLTGVSSQLKASKYVLRYTRWLMDASPKFPIYFLKVYNIRYACLRQAELFLPAQRAGLPSSFLVIFAQGHPFP